MLICGWGVRRQGLEPRTRWLRVGPYVCRMLPRDAAVCRFRTSRSVGHVECCHHVSHSVRPLGLPSGSQLSLVALAIDADDCGARDLMDAQRCGWGSVPSPGRHRPRVVVRSGVRVVYGAVQNTCHWPVGNSTGRP